MLLPAACCEEVRQTVDSLDGRKSTTALRRRGFTPLLVQPVELMTELEGSLVLIKASNCAEIAAAELLNC